MKKIIAYLVFIGLVDIVLLAATRTGHLPVWWSSLGLVTTCALIGGVGAASCTVFAAST